MKKLEHGCLARQRLLLTAMPMILALTATCAIKKVETSKSLYQQAIQAQESGNDVQAIVYWKALLQQTTKEIESANYPATNHFLRATAHFELGNWEAGFDDLRQVPPESLTAHEFWIYPLYSVLLGDYYSRQNMTAVAETFYQAVLKKSTYKASPIYLLALERRVNNSIRSIELQTKERQDAGKFRSKQYEDLTKDVRKYAEEFPYSAVPHFLLGDLLLKQGEANEALEHFLASLELRFPTTDLQKSAEFEIATLLSSHTISPELKSILLKKAAQWWEAEDNGTIFQSGENSLQWIRQKDATAELPADLGPAQKVRYLAVRSEDRWKLLLWEKR